MSIRITGGIYGGIKFSVPKELDEVIRPTQDRVREAIFSSLSSRINLENLKVLDLFSGTGIMSMEAISRGAINATMVDNNRKSIKFSLEIAQKLKIEDKTTQICSDSISYISGMRQQYDLIFIDPPYRKFNFASIISALIDKSALASPGVIVYEEDLQFFNSQYELSRDSIASHFSSVTLKVYGSTSVAFFQNLI